MSSGVSDFIAFVEHMSVSHLEIMNKVNLITAIRVKARVNKMNKIHKETGVAEGKIHNLLENFKCKLHALCAKK